MKKKLDKYQKVKTKLEKKMGKTTNNANLENTSINNSTNNFEQQINNYPSDIQGLFERLGIE